MIFEILYTVDLLSAFLYKENFNIPTAKIMAFKNTLTKILIKNYANIWDKNNPTKYRNLRSIKFNYYIDFQILMAWTNQQVDLPLKLANQIFPTDLIIYCDPNLVTFKYKQNTKILFQNFDYN